MTELTYNVISDAWKKIHGTEFDMESAYCILFAQGWDAALTAIAESIERKAV